MANTGVVTFTPASGFTNDPAIINYTISDATGGTSNSGSITFNYNQIAPVAVNDTNATAFTTGSAGTLNVTTNDTDANGDKDVSTVGFVIPSGLSGATLSNNNKTLTVTGEGVWTVANTGVVTFTPASGFTNDPAIINYTISDATGGASNPGRITFNYNQIAPVAVNDTNATAFTTGSAGTLNVTTNDTDANGDKDVSTVTFVIPSGLSGATLSNNNKTLTVTGEGVWTVSNTGVVTFTPASGFTNDPAIINYTISDATGGTSNPGSITFNYNQIAPVAVNDTNATAFTTGSAGTLNVTTNDTDANGDKDVSTVKFVIPSGLSGATLSNGNKRLTVTGEGVWTVSNTGVVTFTPASGFTNDPAIINYTISDVTGGTSNPGSITFNYNQIAPVAVNDTNATAFTTGSAGTLNVTTNDTDANGDKDVSTVTFVIPSGLSGATLSNNNKTLTVTNQGVWTVANTGVVTFTPASGFTNDPAVINYVISDATGGTSNSGSITFNYNQVAPVAVNDTNATAFTTGSAGTLNVTTNDTDANGDKDVSTVTFVIPSGLSGATLSNNNKTLTVTGEGVWTVANTGVVTFTPANGFTNDPAVINYVLSDATGGASNAGSITFNYNQIAPVAVNDTNATAFTTGSAATFNVITNDTDANNDLDASTVEFMIPNGLNGATLSNSNKRLTVTGEGVWTVANTGVVTFAPSSSFNTSSPTAINYVVSDRTGLSSSVGSISLVYNIPPVAVNDAPTTTFTTRNAATFNVTTNDTDANSDLSANTVEFRIPSGLSGATLSNSNKTLTVTNQGVWTVANTGVATFTPATNFTGDPAVVNYVVFDATGLTSNQGTITFDYNQVNPVAVNDANATAFTTGGAATLNVTANDTDANSDIDTGTVEFRIPSGLSGATLSNSNKTLTVTGQGVWTVANTGVVTFTPASSFTGDPAVINYVVFDATGLTSNLGT
ncbi:Ig-like domain-containing protein, partial [Candidatus Ichthyocystis hellenicum]|uniref:Ig-like domain-containing protein n=1 Tax=Candidatus Ichthyocystis hellenicum TaxID=1561003 RepID=UPI001F5FAFA7